VKKKLYPALVSLLGSVGLAGALGYLFAGVLMFFPGFEKLSEFMVGRTDLTPGYGWTLVAVPFVLLLAHLYTRARLGFWFVRHGWIDEAIAYTQARLKTGLFRSKNEVRAHRAALGWSLAHRGEYAAAWEVLEEADAPPGAPFATAVIRWRLEVALRRENLVDCHRVLERIDTIRARTADVCAIWGCAAEVAARESDEVACREALEKARWVDADAPRTGYAAALCAEAFAHDDEELEEAAASLKRALTALDRDLPLRGPEARAHLAEVLRALGRADQARAVLEEARALEGDPRSVFVLSQTPPDDPEDTVEPTDDAKRGRELTDDDDLREAIASAERLAVIGMKPSGPALDVPRYMEARGYAVVPVNPGYDEVAGHPAADRVDEVEGPVDMVVVFRRSEYVADHVDEILGMSPPPRTVWMQLGIRSPEATRRLTEARIDVVQDRCLQIEYPRLFDV